MGALVASQLTFYPSPFSLLGTPNFVLKSIILGDQGECPLTAPGTDSISISQWLTTLSNSMPSFDSKHFERPRPEVKPIDDRVLKGKKNQQNATTNIKKRTREKQFLIR